MELRTLADTAATDELLPKIAAGDAAAFVALFERRRLEVFRFALQMTGSPAVAEDVTQEVFLAVIGDAARYEPGRSTERAWLCGIARNHVRRHADRERPTIGLAEDDASELPQTAETALWDPVNSLVRDERVEALRRAVASLPLHYREAVVLCDLQELSYADAAAALGCAIGTVRSRLSRARARLAAKLGPARAAGAPAAGDGVATLERAAAGVRCAI